MTDRQWVNQKISEGKKAQYKNGQTPLQIKGRVKQSKTLKQYFQSNHNQMVSRQKKKGNTLSKRIKEKGLTDKERARNRQRGRKNIRIVTIKISYPNGKYTQEISTIGQFTSKYQIETTVISSARKSPTKQFLFKRRTSRTRHIFPENTVLTLIDEYAPDS